MNMEKRHRDRALSPVVGVLLLLMITIIIAAAISGFAVGLAKNMKKVPQISLGAKVIDGTSIVLIHQGGDPLSWENIEFRTSIPTGMHKDIAYAVDLQQGTYIPTNQSIISVHDTYAPLFRAGDEVWFNWFDCFKEINSNYMTPVKGEQLVLQLLDKASGNMIVEKTVTVV